MNGRWYLWGCILLVALTAMADCKKRRRKNFIGKRGKYGDIMLADDPLFSVEAIEPLRTTKIGTCECKCCQPQSAALHAKPECENDIIVAVDSSACFRDHHRRMKQFLQKLVNEIHKSKDYQFGVNKTRLAIMQFSSEQHIPIPLDAFGNYEDPTTSKKLKAKINEAIAELGFLGQGAYLDAALNATAAHFTDASRRPYRNDNVQKTVIVLTNGKSHPRVTSQNVEASVQYLRDEQIKILPVSVTRQCYSHSPDWDEGLCPDINILKMLGGGSYTDGEDFLPMRASGTVSTVVKDATTCPKGPASLIDSCNTCNCSCELPVGPRGLKGQPGDGGSDGKQGPKGEAGEPGRLGDKGFNGTKGDQGLKGSKGDYGVKGEKGDIGPIGNDGLPGTKGEPGENGTIGEVGPRGPKGENGTKGGTGEKGDVGQKGDAGAKGETGHKGADGNDGQDGDKGDKGEQGIGTKGTHGDKGDQGDKGENGTFGEPGVKGPKGERGLCGKPGPAGEKGSPGLPGIDGLDGEMGKPGLQGKPGPEGPRGTKGSRGETGRDGEVGPVGPTGPPGPEGPQGLRGPPGARGSDSNVAGPKGDEGQQGQKGERGDRGASGLDGSQGVQGVRGPRGFPGAKGEEGAIDKNSLRPLLVELIRELLPGECVVSECTEYPIDLVFLIDGSDSIDQDDWTEIQNWILKTVDRFNPAERTNKLQVDVVQYSEDVRNEVHQIIQSSSDEIRAAVQRIELMRSGTKTFTGLRYINSDVTPNTREGSYRILITMGDGDTYEERDQRAIDIARSNYDLMLAVGIGSKIHLDKLVDFTHQSQPISVTDFASLRGIIDKIVDETCKNIEEGNARSTDETDRNLPEPTPPAPIRDQLTTQCADTSADIAFLISGSSSISNDDFNTVMEFLHGAIKKSFKPTNSRGFRFSLIQYNVSTSTALTFDDSTDKNAVLSAINKLRYAAGDARTGNALEQIKNVFEYVRNSGNRIGVPQIAVVFTDGRSQDDVRESALALQDAGVYVLAVAVTEASPQDELAHIASSVENIHSILSMENEESLLRDICKCAKGSYIVYDDAGENIVDTVFFGDVDVTTASPKISGIEEPEASGFDINIGTGFEEDGELP